MKVGNTAAANASGFIGRIRRGLLGKLNTKSIPELDRLEKEAHEAFRTASNEKDWADILNAIGLIGITRNAKQGLHSNREYRLAMQSERRRICAKAASLWSKAGYKVAAVDRQEGAGKRSGGASKGAVLADGHVYTEGEKVPAVALNGHVYKHRQGRWK